MSELRNLARDEWLIGVLKNDNKKSPISQLNLWNRFCAEWAWLPSATNNTLRPSLCASDSSLYKAYRTFKADSHNTALRTHVNHKKLAGLPEQSDVVNIYRQCVLTATQSHCSIPKPLADLANKYTTQLELLQQGHVLVSPDENKELTVNFDAINKLKHGYQLVSSEHYNNLKSFYDNSKHQQGLQVRRTKRQKRAVADRAAQWVEDAAGDQMDEGELLAF